MTGNKEAIVDQWAAFRAQMDPGLYHFGRWAFERIASGAAPTLDEGEVALHLAKGTADAHARALVQMGLMTLEARRITGAMGLSSTPTPHHLLLDGRSLYAWCALDAVGIPAALGSNAVVRSQALPSGRPIEISLEKGRLKSAPEGIRLSLPDPTLDRSIREAVCPAISFYEEPRAPRHARVALLTLPEALETGRRLWGPV